RRARHPRRTARRGRARRCRCWCRVRRRSRVLEELFCWHEECRSGVLISSPWMASRMLEARTVAAVDPGGMRDIIASLPEQLSTGLKVGEAAPVPIEEAQRIFIVGMGGSAIGGDVFAAWLADRAKIPIQVVRDYRLPAYAGPEDLLVAISYSGNTEETLAATAQGIKLGCRVVAITSGGTLRDLARGNRMRVFAVPTGLPPRAAFGHPSGTPP